MSGLHRRTLLSLLLAAPLSAPAAEALRIYGYRVLERRPQSRDHFVQGMEFHGGTLYVGTGRYGESRLLAYRFADMQLLQQRRLPDALFGEGISRLGGRIYQLTWRAGRILSYDAASLAPLAEYPVDREGWGLTNDGSQLIASDGTARLYFLDPQTLALRRTLEVRLRGRPQGRLNELEWIDGEIWANVWLSDFILRIDPASGAVTGVVDLRGLLDPADRRPGTDVLNGIAWDTARGDLWVTGKRWPWLFRIAVEERPGTLR